MVLPRAQHPPRDRRTSPCDGFLLSRQSPAGGRSPQSRTQVYFPPAPSPLAAHAPRPPPSMGTFMPQSPSSYLAILPAGAERRGGSWGSQSEWGARALAKGSRVKGVCPHRNWAPHMLLPEAAGNPLALGTGLVPPGPLPAASPASSIVGQGTGCSGATVPHPTPCMTSSKGLWWGGTGRDVFGSGFVVTFHQGPQTTLPSPQWREVCTGLGQDAHHADELHLGSPVLLSASSAGNSFHTWATWARTLLTPAFCWDAG